MKNHLIFIAFNVGHLALKYLDVFSSRKFSSQGIKEANWFTRDKNKMFVEWKAWVLILSAHAVAVSLYIYGPPNSYGTMHPLHAGIVFILSGLVSAICFQTNMKNYRNRKKSL